MRNGGASQSDVEISPEVGNKAVSLFESDTEFHSV